MLVHTLDALLFVEHRGTGLIRFVNLIVHDRQAPEHGIEKANFLEAYKGFAKWAQSSGKNEQNWYNQGNADKSLLIHN